MIHYSTIVTIDRRPGDVLAALLDASSYGRWTEMVDTQFDGPGVPTVGTRGAFRFPAGPLKGRYEMEIVRLEPDRRLDVQIDGPSLRWFSNITLEPDGAGTRMTYAGDISLLGWRRVLEPLMAREAQAGEAKEAERFKAMLESEMAPATAPG
jgi:carbon monoxide dehydrogenase subunit G